MFKLKAASTNSENLFRRFKFIGNRTIKCEVDVYKLSKSLAAKNPDTILIIERRGTPKRATNYTGKRFPGVGMNDSKASDHCPVSIEFEL